MSDAEYITNLRDRLDAVYNALIEFDDTHRYCGTEYDPDDARAKFRALEAAGQAAVERLGPRMMEVAAKYNLPDPAMWGSPLVDLLSHWAFGNAAHRIGPIQDRYHKLNTLSRLLAGNGVAGDRPGESTPPAGELPALTANDVRVLAALRKVHPRALSLYDVAADSGVARGTAGTRINYLIKHGLAVRPNGSRSGVALTTKGLAVPPDALGDA
ncbi:MAG: hypothetical protein U0746_13850 [Gemmataceae bacterium]